MTALTACDAATETLQSLQQKVVFMDKRVIPPFRRHDNRITGTLHLPRSVRQSGRPRSANSAAV